MNSNSEATGRPSALLCVGCGSEIPTAASGAVEAACPVCGRVHLPELPARSSELKHSPDSIFDPHDATEAPPSSSNALEKSNVASPVEATAPGEAMVGGEELPAAVPSSASNLDDDGGLASLPSPGVSPPRVRLRPRIPLSIWLLAILVPYCAASSVGMWLLYQQLKSVQRHSGSPGTEPEPAPIAVAGTLNLGESRRLGNTLEITPVEARRVRGLRYSFPADQGIRSGEVVVLQLRIRNLSRGILRPLLPAFNQCRESALTWLEIDGVKYYGPSEDASLERFEGQTFGEVLPGQTIESLVFAARSLDGKEIGDALHQAGDETQLRWQIALHRGRNESLGKDALSTVVLVSVRGRKSELK